MGVPLDVLLLRKTEMRFIKREYNSWRPSRFGLGGSKNKNETRNFNPIFLIIIIKV